MSREREFREYREKMNEKILEAKHVGINRFFNLDTKAYEDGALDAKTKEIAGLADRWRGGSRRASRGSPRRP